MATHVLQSMNRSLGNLLPGLAARLAARLFTTPVRRRRARPVPADAEPITFRFGLAGLRWGQTGPLVLALHGWQGHAAQFAPLAQRLVQHGYRVIALEAPAHGRSPGRHAHPIIFSDALLEIRDELGAIHAVIGHSMGGGAIIHALSQGLPANRAIVIAAPSAFLDVLQRGARHLGLPARARNRFIALMERLTGIPVQSLDIAAEGARLEQPLLVVHDHNDAVIPYADGERIAQLTGAELISTRGLGHGAILRDGAVANAVLTFLDP